MAEPLGVVIGTHHRVDDARVNMEIIRETWPAVFDRVVIVHADNGPVEWTPYLEDHTVRVGPGRGHYCGAADLLDAGVETIARHHPDIRFVVGLASDCWMYRPERLHRIVDDMRRGELRLAAADWRVSDHTHGVARVRDDPDLLPGRGLSTDFFVVDLPWARENGLFPLDLDGFISRNAEMLNYLQELVLLEKHLEGKFLGAVRTHLERIRWSKDGWGSEGPRRARAMLRLVDERPIDPTGTRAPIHKGHWPELGLITIEDPATKRAEMLRVQGVRGGPLLRRFLTGDDVAWFNGT